MATISNKSDRPLTINHRRGKAVSDDIEALRSNSIKITLLPNTCTEVDDEIFAEIKKDPHVSSFINSLVDQGWIEIDESSSPDKAIQKMEKFIQQKEGEHPNKPESDVELNEKAARRGRPPKNDPELVL